MSHIDIVPRGFPFMHHFYSIFIQYCTYTLNLNTSLRSILSSKDHEYCIRRRYYETIYYRRLENPAHCLTPDVESDGMGESGARMSRCASSMAIPWCSMPNISPTMSQSAQASANACGRMMGDSHSSSSICLPIL